MDILTETARYPNKYRSQIELERERIYREVKAEKRYKKTNIPTTGIWSEGEKKRIKQVRMARHRARSILHRIEPLELKKAHGDNSHYNGGNTGKINEGLVAIDLIKHGYDIYSPYSPTHPFDILAIKNGVGYRVEVKTGNVNKEGKLLPYTSKLNINNFDILAVLYNTTGGYEIVYKEITAEIREQLRGYNEIKH